MKKNVFFILIFVLLCFMIGGYFAWQITKNNPQVLSPEPLKEKIRESNEALKNETLKEKIRESNEIVDTKTAENEALKNETLKEKIRESNEIVDTKTAENETLKNEPLKKKIRESNEIVDTKTTENETLKNETLNNQILNNNNKENISLIKNMQHIITIKTNMGEIRFTTYDADAPKAVNNFITLAQKGFYNGTIFHRVINGFMIQGGDPEGTGMGGPGYTFEDELNSQTDSYKEGYKKGVVAMANAGPNTNGSQFFIMTDDYPLPNSYTIFGKVDSGQEVVDAIAKSKTEANDRPVSSIIMEKVTASESEN